MGYVRHHAFRLRGTAVASIPAPSEGEFRPPAASQLPWWAGRRPDRAGRTRLQPPDAQDPHPSPASGPLGVVRDLARHDPRPPATIAADADTVNAAYEVAQGPYLALLYPDERFCSECGRRQRFCSCQTIDPAGMTVREIAQACVDDPEWREAFGPRLFRLPMG